MTTGRYINPFERGRQQEQQFDIGMSLTPTQTAPPPTENQPSWWDKFAKMFPPTVSEKVTRPAPPQRELDELIRLSRYNELHSPSGMPVKRFDSLNPTQKKELYEYGERIEIANIGGERRAKIAGKPSPLYERVEEAITSVVETPLFTVGGVGISAPTIVATGLIAMAGWQALVVGIPAAYQTLMRASVNRNINSWAKSAGVTIPKETRTFFTDTIVNEARPSWLIPNALKTLFKPIKAGGFEPTPAAQKAADVTTKAIVKTYLPEFSMTRTQDVITGIRAGRYTGEIPSVAGVQAARAELPIEPIKPPVTPEVTTEQLWNSTEVADRAIWAKQANLEGKLGSKAWASLTREQQDAIMVAREEIIPTISKAGMQPLPPTPVEPPPLPPEGVTLGRTPNEWTGSMADLQDADTVAQIAFRDDIVRRFVNATPAIRNITGALNPSAVANTPAEQAIIIRATLKDEGSQKSLGVISHLHELGMQDKVFGKLAEDGSIASGTLKGKFLNDIRTYPDRYTLTDAQKQWIQRAEDIEKAKLDFLTRNGIEINELSFAEGGRYAGRKVYAQVVEGEVADFAFVGTGARRPGAKLPVEKHRTFDSVEEAVKAGYRYLPEDEALFLNVQGAYNRVADKKMADWLLNKVPWRTTGASEELKLAAEAAQQKYNNSKQLLAALNRAIRGERIPDSTLNSIAVSYPEQANELRKLIPLIQQGAPTAKRVQQLTNTAKGLVSTNKNESQRAVNARARDREKALQVHLGEATVPAPAFAGKILTGPEAKETARKLRESFEPEFSKALAQVNKANAVARYFVLAGDFSPMAIQLIFLLGENPVTYGQAFVGGIRALADPKFIPNYLSKHKATIDRHPNLLIPVGGTTEFTEAMASGGWLSGKTALLPQTESYWRNLALFLPRVVGKVGATLLTPFQRFFESTITVAGIEMAEAYEAIAKTPADIADLDQFINEFRGVTSSARIGVSPGQQQVETGLLLAPRYNRAIAGLLFDLGRGGIRGNRARISLAKGVAAVSAMALLVSLARGETREKILDHFNPNSPDFFTWEVAGQKIGPGSKIRSVIKLFAQSIDNPESLLQFSMENPAFRFVRGNMAPMLGSAIDIITGRNYIGDPTRDGMLSFTKNVLAENLLPVWVQSTLLEGGDVKGRTVRGIAEFMGGRGYPEPLWDEIGKLRDKYAKMDFTLKYEELNREQIDGLRRSHPDLKEMEEKAKVEQSGRGSEFDMWLMKTTEQVVEERDNSLEQAATLLKQGLISKQDYDSERGYARPYYSGARAVLWSARETLEPYAVKQINKWMGENQKPEDKSLDDFMEFYAGLIEKSALPRDWDKLNLQTELYLAKLPRATRDYVKRNRNRWIESLPENALAIETYRLEAIENETWWDDYRELIRLPIGVEPTKPPQRPTELPVQPEGGAYINPLDRLR